MYFMYFTRSILNIIGIEVYAKNIMRTLTYSRMKSVFYLMLLQLLQCCLPASFHSRFVIAPCLFVSFLVLLDYC